MCMLCVCEFLGGFFDILNCPYTPEEVKCLNIQIFPRPRGIRAAEQVHGQMGLALLAS